LSLREKNLLNIFFPFSIVAGRKIFRLEGAFLCGFQAFLLFASPARFHLQRPANPRLRRPPARVLDPGIRALRRLPRTHQKRRPRLRHNRKAPDQAPNRKVLPNSPSCRLGCRKCLSIEAYTWEEILLPATTLAWRSRAITSRKVTRPNWRA